VTGAAEVRERGLRVIEEDLLDRDEPTARHHPGRLARVIAENFLGAARRRTA
jgi:hypothetical protein